MRQLIVLLFLLSLGTWGQVVVNSPNAKECNVQGFLAMNEQKDASGTTHQTMCWNPQTGQMVFPLPSTLSGAQRFNPSTTSANECGLIAASEGGAAESILSAVGTDGLTHDLLCWNATNNRLVIPEAKYVFGSTPYAGIDIWQNVQSTNGNVLLGFARNGDPGTFQPGTFIGTDGAIRTLRYIVVSGHSNNATGPNGYNINDPNGGANGNMLSVWPDVAFGIIIRHGLTGSPTPLSILGEQTFGTDETASACNGSTNCGYTWAIDPDGNYFLAANTNNSTTGWDTSYGRVAAGKIGIGTGAAGSTAGGIQATFYQLVEATVSTLPACNAGTQGQLRAVSDATAPTYNGTLTGGGAVHVPVYCDGSAWHSH